MPYGWPHSGSGLLYTMEICGPDDVNRSVFRIGNNMYKFCHGIVEGRNSWSELLPGQFYTNRQYRIFYIMSLIQLIIHSQ